MGLFDQCPLEERLAGAWPPSEWADVHVVAAVSAGPDSIALLRLLLAIKGRVGGSGKLYVGHVNHHLRGADADADQQWLAALCQRLGVPLEVCSVNVSELAAADGDGWEAAARQARYNLLKAMAERLGARAVVTGHTADDQVETVLHHIVRGTGLAGLGGMPPARPLSATVSLVRPLLGVWRHELVAHLSDLGQDFRTDASNADARFTRNRLRHELLPLVRDWFNADVDAALLRLASQASEAQRVIADIVARLCDQCVELGRGENRDAIVTDTPVAWVRIDCRPLAGQAPLLVRELCKVAWQRAGWPLQAMGFSQWCQLAQLVADGECPVLNLPGGVRAERDGDLLALRLLAPGG